MSWIHKLYETYENCQSQIGVQSTEDKAILLPICHTTQKAHIEITIDEDGNFLRARVIPEEDSRTIVPCTESSSGRSGKKPANHPLCDKLQYVAGDFSLYGGKVTSGFNNNPKEPFENYKEILQDWCNSNYSHPKVKAVLEYISKETVIKDLIAHKILFTDESNLLIDKWNKSHGDEKPDIFKVANTQSEAFVRWRVEMSSEADDSLSMDVSVYKSWIDYYSSTKIEKNLCYVTGKNAFLADQHPAKIRNDGDKAKIISSNDSDGYTFRGRFSTAQQAVSISFEVTQKAHNALRWLIERQGKVFYEGKGIKRKPGLTVVAWATKPVEIPDVLCDTFDLLGFEDLKSDTSSVYTAQELAIKLKHRISGYSSNLDDTTDVIVLGLDSATPGRMAITFYRELTGSDFLNRVEYWHETCAWLHDYKLSDKSKSEAKKIHIRFVGAPSPWDIAEAAYSSKIDDKLRRVTVERLLPCIVDMQRIPRDLVELAYRRACNRHSMSDWEWNKTLSIACALYKKLLFDYGKEDMKMALDENRSTRDYLYGRLLALADSMEQRALAKGGEDRQTTAARLMQRFADHPYSTWRTIELALAPYKARLGRQSIELQRLISEVTAMFTPEDYMNDKKLSGEFLLGYHCQREALRKNKTDED